MYFMFFKKIKNNILLTLIFTLLIIPNYALAYSDYIVAGGENDPVVSGKRMEKGVHRMRKLPCLNDLLHIVPPRDALSELVERGGRLTAAAFLRAVGAKAGKGGVPYGAEQIRAEMLRALRRDGVPE